MADVTLTAAQQAAVDDRGGSLLVSAAAGSGKTKVLVERLFSYIRDEHCQVDDFLIITYTKAAAAELRGKIAQELARQVAAHPEDAHLRRQMFRVYQADIKTVDAFCAGLLRENIHLLPSAGLTPDFRVADQQETLTLQERVLERVLEQFYSGIETDPQAQMLAETLGAGRDDRALEGLVLELYQKVQSHVYPLRWLESQREQWEKIPENLEESPFGREVMADTVRKASFWAEMLERAVEEMAACPAVAKAYADRFAETAVQLRQFAPHAQKGWEELSRTRAEFRRMGAVKDEEGGDMKPRMQALLKQCKADIKDWEATYAISQEDYLADLTAMAPAMLALLDLTAAFAAEYQKEKERRNLVDFSDQEHNAIAILLNKDGAPSELGQQISQRYKEIMVDEYQDTNEVQNCIFRAISREEKNLFTVGDVKQSIYRFRLADPTIFLKKYRDYLPAEDAPLGSPRKLSLSQNFRSREQVLSATNFVFRNILSQDMGEMDYTPDQALYFGASYYLPRTDTRTEFHLIHLADTEEESFDRTESEAAFVAHRIRQLLDEKYPVQGGDGALHPIRPEDIVILMRSPRSRLPVFTRALERENIPCASQETADFFSSLEIAVMLSFLEIIDNPRQDVPLIAVLRSPLFGFTPDRLALLRAAAPGDDFYGALCADGRDDAKAFLEQLSALRASAQDLTVDRLLFQIYNRCNVMGVFGAMPEGRQRCANLTALYEYARQMVSAGRMSVFDFTAYLRRLLENDEVPAISTRQASGGVRIMSIHQSKGLEFPVVILADLNKKFNREDLNRPVLVHPQLGLGTECVDLARRIRYDTVSKTALALRLEREAKAEELRILYVAMTRAKEKLILVDCMKRGQKHLGELLSVASCPVSPEAVAGGKSLGDWVLLPLLCRPEAEPLRRLAGGSLPLCRDDEEPWQVFCHENPTWEREESLSADNARAEEEPFDGGALDWVYAAAPACAIPSKVTATQLKGRELDEEIAEGAVKEYHLPSFEKPLFMQGEKQLSATERGTATHLVMQYLDFDTEASEKAVSEAVKGMEERRLITREQAWTVDTAAIAAFLRSSVAQEIRTAKRVWREYRFALLVPAKSYDKNLTTDDEMMLQGVTDCCFETEEGLTVVDFKTDRIEPGEEAQRAKWYRGQLEAYAQALEKVLQIKAHRKVLYFFATNKEITL